MALHGHCKEGSPTSLKACLRGQGEHSEIAFLGLGMQLSWQSAGLVCTQASFESQKRKIEQVCCASSSSQHQEVEFKAILDYVEGLRSERLRP